MSHVMLKSVIRMPFDVAMGDHFSKLQFYQRAQQALNELEALQAKLAEQHTPAAWLNEETGDVISSELKADAPEMLKGMMCRYTSVLISVVKENLIAQTRRLHQKTHLKCVVLSA